MCVLGWPLLGGWVEGRAGPEDDDEAAAGSFLRDLARQLSARGGPRWKSKWRRGEIRPETESGLCCAVIAVGTVKSRVCGLCKLRCSGVSRRKGIARRIQPPAELLKRPAIP